MAQIKNTADAGYKNVVENGNSNGARLPGPVLVKPGEPIVE